MSNPQLMVYTCQVNKWIEKYENNIGYSLRGFAISKTSLHTKILIFIFHLLHFLVNDASYKAKQNKMIMQTKLR